MADDWETIFVVSACLASAFIFLCCCVFVLCGRHWFRRICPVFFGRTNMPNYPRQSSIVYHHPSSNVFYPPPQPQQHHTTTHVVLVQPSSGGPMLQAQPFIQPIPQEPPAQVMYDYNNRSNRAAHWFLPRQHYEPPPFYSDK